jgi:hypothetical protein
LLVVLSSDEVLSVISILYLSKTKQKIEIAQTLIIANSFFVGLVSFDVFVSGHVVKSGPVSKEIGCEDKKRVKADNEVPPRHKFTL